jgi:hypothetical protein
MLDELFAPHGHRIGLSLGGVSLLWLSPLLSEADPRPNHVKPWTVQWLYTLRQCTAQPVHPLPVGDDWLATTKANRKTPKESLMPRTTANTSAAIPTTTQP